MRNDYVKIWAPDHPLRGARGDVFEHRVVLYDAIGPGSHRCHWCQRLVTWRVRRGATPQVDDLVVDHLDGDRANNVRENLVPSCQPCNVSQGYGPNRIRGEETQMVRPNGTKLRAGELVCEHCGATFLRAPGLTKSGRQFCSRPCANEGLRREVCRRGHPRTPENVTPANQCRECMRLASARYHERQRAKKR